MYINSYLAQWLEYSMCSINFTTNCCFWFGEWRDKDLYVKPFSGKRTLASHSHFIYLTLSLSYCYFCLCLFGKRVSRHHCCRSLELCCVSFTSVRKRSSLAVSTVTEQPSSCVELRAHGLCVIHFWSCWLGNTLYKTQTLTLYICDWYGSLLFCSIFISYRSSIHI